MVYLIDKACPSEKYNEWWEKLGVPRESLAIFLILFGLYFIVMGVSYWVVNSFLINSTILGITLYMIFSHLFSMHIGFFILIALVISFFVLSFRSINPIMLGIVFGFIVGTLIFNCLLKITFATPMVLFWVSIATSILISCIIGYFLDIYMVCLTTSLVGAYILVRVYNFVKN